MNWLDCHTFTEAFQKLFLDLNFGNQAVLIDAKYVTAMRRGWVPDKDDTIARFAEGLRQFPERPPRYIPPSAQELIALANKQGRRKSYLEFQNGLTATKSPPRLAPPELEIPVGDFVGRETETELLLTTLRQNEGVRIAMIYGMPSTGKSQLALRVAHKLKADFPDARLLIRLRDEEGTPQTLREALVKAISQLRSQYAGLDLPPDVETLKGIYRSLLTDTKSLVIVDNARKMSDVEALRPAPGCGMLVTSRALLSLPGAHKIIRLDPLPSGKALNLLSAICSKVIPAINLSPATAEEICKYCGWLPLAIRSAGNFLVKRRPNPEAYAKRLSYEHNRLAEIGNTDVPIGVTASFNLSYVELSEGAKTVFQDLAVFPDSFTAAAEKIICNDPMEAHLEELCDQALVNREELSQRYSMHDLLRVFAWELLEPRAHSLAKRHAEYYLSVYAQAEKLFSDNEDTLAEGAQIFMAEETNILTGWRWAAKMFDGDTDVAKLSCQFADIALELPANYLHPDERIHLYDAAIAAAQKIDRSDYEAMACRRLARAHYDSGRNSELSTRLLERSLAIARSSENLRQQQAALGLLARNVMRTACNDRQKMRNAIELQLEAFRLAKQIGEIGLLVRAVGALGSLYVDFGNYKKAICCYNAELAMVRKLRKPRLEASALNGLGHAYHKLKNKKKAIPILEQALAMAEKYKDWKIVNTACVNLGRVFHKDDPERAIGYFNRSLEFNRTLGNPRRQSGAYFDIGFAQGRLGRNRSAVQSVRRALNFARDAEDDRGVCKALELLAELLCRRWPRRAVVLGEAALEIGLVPDKARILERKIQLWQSNANLRTPGWSRYRNQMRRIRKNPPR